MTNKSDIIWHNETRKLSDLIPVSYNPRKLSKKERKDLKKSLCKFNLAEVPVINTDSTILAGHQRCKILAEIENKDFEIDVRVPNRKLTKEESDEYLIRSNKNTGEFDFELLVENFEIDDLVDFGFNEEDFDFTEPEEIGEIEGEDDIPEPPKEPITKRGDVWILGNHRLLCGDATSIDDVDKLMDFEKADMVFTDPPYKLETKGGSKGSLGKSMRKLASSIEFISDFDPSDFLNILPAIFSKNKINSYIFCNKDLLPDYLMWVRNNKYSFNVLVWKKPNAMPIQGSHRPDIEYLLLFRKNATWNQAVKDVSYSRLIEYGKERGLHPTMKPVALIVNQIKISSKKDDLIVDVFGGSGSTLIACEKTKRKCFMMEIESRYCDIIVTRWQEFTGNSAILEETGECYG